MKDDCWKHDRLDFMNKLRNTAEVLLAYEVNVDNLKYIDRFIFNDKEN